MKKWRTMFVMALAAVFVFAAAACGDAEDTAEAAAETDGGNAEASAESNAAGGYTVTLRGVTIVMNEEAAPIVEALGDDYSYFESESCAFEGLDKVYSYSGFKLNTYPTDEVDYVSSVVFMDDTVETDEGICIGSARDAVIEAYGEPDVDNGTSLVYTREDSTMTVGISNDSVSSLEIVAITES